MSTRRDSLLGIIASLVFAGSCLAQQLTPDPHTLYQFDDNVLSTRWSSPENPNGVKGQGGKENHGAKGRAWVSIDTGATLSLLDVAGPGMITRMWVTIDDRRPEMLRSLKVEMFWDDASKPAVSVPFGDFFGVGLGRTATFQNALFADPENRSFVAMISMPFKTHAKIVIVNEGHVRLSHIFYDVDFEVLQSWKPNFMYFHAHWNRDTATALGKDFEILPAVKGKGRYIGTNFGINVNPVYADSWWGEGEVKMYTDGDGDTPTIVGTGTEDYISTGWGLELFTNPYSGCLVRPTTREQWSCYRYHVPDPVFFRTSMRVTLQQMGGNSPDKVRSMLADHVPMLPVWVDANNRLTLAFKTDSATLAKILEGVTDRGWFNFFRTDDMSATAYFYLDSPVDDLPALQPVDIRTYRL